MDFAIYFKYRTQLCYSYREGEFLTIRSVIGILRERNIYISLFLFLFFFSRCYKKTCISLRTLSNIDRYFTVANNVGARELKYAHRGLHFMYYTCNLRHMSRIYLITVSQTRSEKSLFKFIRIYNVSHVDVTISSC